MTQLRKMMLEELERRNYSQSTVRTYVKTIADLARYFKGPPDQLRSDQLRQYQAYLFRERKLAANTVNQRTAALRFFFVTTTTVEVLLQERFTQPSTKSDCIRLLFKIQNCSFKAS